MRSLIALTAALFLTVPACAAPVPAPSGVDMATARRIEQTVVLPAGSRPLSGYARYYYQRPNDPLSVVTGEYIRTDEGLGGWPAAGIYLTAPRVGIDDGGCGAVVTVTYDTARDQIVRVTCNGIA